MGCTQVGVETGRCRWWERLTARLRPAPTRPPSYHATRTANVRPGGGKHRHTPGGLVTAYRLLDGRVVKFRSRRP
jgi:hypothetical protein